MLIDEYVKIIGNSKNLKIYKEKGYDIIVGQLIFININDLSTGSTFVVNVACDICHYESSIRYQKYIKNLHNGDYGKFTCKKCSGEKRKLNTIKKYGVAHISQLTSVKEKIKDHWKQQGNFINAFQCPDVKNKMKLTFIENYGVSNPSQSDEIKQKKIDTCLKNFGVPNNMQNPISFHKNQVSGKRLLTHEKSTLTYRGSYEKDFLDKYYSKIKIEKINTIKYKFLNKIKIYYPDFYLPEFNMIIEIKNDYSYKNFIDQNTAKKNSCIEQGFNFLFIINKNYHELEQILQK